MAVSRPLVYGCLIVVAASALWLGYSDSGEKPKTLVVKHKPAAVTSDNDLIEADYTTTFEKPKGSLRNIFVPLVQAAEDKPLTLTLKAPAQDLDRIPADIAGGEANWIFTGLAEVNGERMALLENSTTHQGGFVKEKESWKSSQLIRITSESVVLRDSKTGAEQVVMRFDPNKPQKPKAGSDIALLPPAGPAPGLANPSLTNPPMQGPIGPRNIRIRPMILQPGGTP